MRIVRFEPGTSTATIGDSARTGDVQDAQYTLRAHAGQVLDAEPLDEGSSTAVDVNVVAPDGAVLGTSEDHRRFALPSTGTYDLVLLRRAAVPYRIRISIH
jgi:hypothetical protein